MSKSYVKLTEEEINERGYQLAEKVCELAIAKNSKKEEMAERNRQIREIETEILVLSEAVRSGQELREDEVLFPKGRLKEVL